MSFLKLFSIVFVLFLIPPVEIFAEESLTVGLDKPMYSLCEVIKIKANAPGANTVGLEIRDANNELIILSGMQFDEGSIFRTQFVIPESLPVGDLSIIATAKINDNIETKTLLIPIVSDKTLCVESPPKLGPSPVSTTDVKISAGSNREGCETTFSCFSPYSISVNVGDVVTWFNEDSVFHIVTSGTRFAGADGEFNSLELFPGNTFSHTFTSPSTYHYFDGVYPWGEGVVIVESLTPIGSLVIPDWVKNVAAFWCDNLINDAAYLDGIQYLIDNGIIIVQATSSVTGGSQEVPAWVKNTACWWSQGLITDKEFALGLEYLIGQGIIRV